MSAVGAALSITATRFVNCSALEGGGAVAAASFTCYGAEEPFNTLVSIDQSQFDHCSSGSSGGAVFVESRSATLTVSSSTFTGCLCNGMGGALAVVNGGTVMAIKSTFLNNIATGFGGGAFYAQNSQLTLHGVSAHDNIAAAGGGGVLYWLGQPPVYVSWCRQGSYPDPAFECTPKNCTGSCLPCRAGTYQMSIGVVSEAGCIPCKPGTFSSITGATACTRCGPGKFSAAVGSSSSSECISCPAGSVSALNTTACWVCQTGNTSIGSVSERNCTICVAGIFLNGTGASSAANCTVLEVLNLSSSKNSTEFQRTADMSMDSSKLGVQIESNVEASNLELQSFW